jgi:hypothetical protein
MKDRDNARKNLAAILPDLKGRWEEWKRLASASSMSVIA